MKKTILICLLGYLCVPTSTTTAQVADSPGADFLHRSRPSVSPDPGDSHRGGAIRPDTLSIGVDRTTNKRAVENPAASEDKVWIYIEIEGSLPDEPLVLSRWSRYNGLGFEKEEAESHILETVSPDFFRGMLPTISAASNTIVESIAKPEYIGLNLGDHKVMPPILAFPGDSILIRYNTARSETLFAGPQGRGAELQQVLATLLDNYEFTPAQLIVVEDRSRYLSNGGTDAKLHSAGKLFGRFLQVVEKGREQMDVLDKRISDSVLVQKIDKQLEVYRDDIPEDRLLLYRADILGKYYAKLSRKLGRILDGHSDPAGDAKATHLLDMLTAHYMKGFDESLVTGGGVDFWIGLAEAKWIYENTAPLQWISRVEKGYSRDILIESYFLRKGKALGDFDTQLEKGIAMVSDSLVHNNLQAVKSARSVGTRIAPVKFLAADGTKVPLNHWKDKVVLVEFWISGCGACYSTYQEIIAPLETYFDGEQRFEMVSVSADKDIDRWKSSIGTYSSVDSENLFLLEEGFGALYSYGIQSYPSFILLGRDGQILRLSGFNRDRDSMISLIEEALEMEFSDVL
ncbi:thiol-disulfide isomerase/thioredoxin [Algoriphagus sp. 4150]|uniref:TlpA family protein disulfide reductase n=1 Tax=Algoriphagus sp. 4150 TaxID=2817756 RepID=UPI002866DA69|nr:thioredoxin family protein [Algoriphagus sp. 4150]MDR7127700.1 thiol-disulfide isomerase/thioredoxin [Algoriphagus sp. 4150]